MYHTHIKLHLTCTELTIQENLYVHLFFLGPTTLVEKLLKSEKRILIELRKTRE